MLGIKKALETFKANSYDPYVIIPDTNIELRFGEDNMIIGAYGYFSDTPKGIRWYSDEFRRILKNTAIGGFTA